MRDAGRREARAQDRKPETNAERLEHVSPHPMRSLTALVTIDRWSGGRPLDKRSDAVYHAGFN